MNDKRAMVTLSVCLLLVVIKTRKMNSNYCYTYSGDWIIRKVRVCCSDIPAVSECFLVKRKKKSCAKREIVRNRRRNIYLCLYYDKRLFCSHFCFEPWLISVSLIQRATCVSFSLDIRSCFLWFLLCFSPLSSVMLVIRVWNLLSTLFSRGHNQFETKFALQERGENTFKHCHIAHSAEKESKLYIHESKKSYKILNIQVKHWEQSEWKETEREEERMNAASLCLKMTHKARRYRIAPWK